MNVLFLRATAIMTIITTTNNNENDDDADEMTMIQYVWFGTMIAPQNQSSDGNLLACHSRPGLGTPRTLGAVL